tara:strand:+ start:81 stop:218 length:138 start_codon:yes stop_codon:yes gene_type:complete
MSHPINDFLKEKFWEEAKAKGLSDEEAEKYVELKFEEECNENYWG